MTNNILVIAPHADDEVLGCGGVIAKHAAAGDVVSILIVATGIPELYPPAVIEQTRQELKEAHTLLGVSNVIFLDYPVPVLDSIPVYRLSSSIEQVIKNLLPTTVYIPHHGDIHIDHQVVYHAASVATRPIRDCSVRKILAYETLSSTEWAAPNAGSVFIPTVFCDITDFIELKLTAMSKIASQLKEPPHSRSLQAIEALARYRGSSVDLHAAEAFMLVREIMI